MKRGTKYTLIGLGVVFAAMQIKTVDRTNHLGAGDPVASREVMWILRRACYDCHSGESRWPIWAYVAPMSWRVVGDVNRARVALNFSDWVAYPVERRVALRAGIDRLAQRLSFEILHHQISVIRFQRAEIVDRDNSGMAESRA